MRAGIAFGSNMGDRLQFLRRARAWLVAGGHVAPPFLLSRIYDTSPVDCTPGAGPFLNAVMEAELTGTPEALLTDLRCCEAGLGEPRVATRNAPREIDLDLLYTGELCLRLPGLILPHPRMAGRRFVLAPLADIRPGLVLPGQGKTVSELLLALPPGDSAEPIDESW